MEKMTNDLISRSELRKELNKFRLSDDCMKHEWAIQAADDVAKYTLEAIKNAIAIDAVPVVRCGECKWVETCKACGDYLGKKGFCSRGKRMDGEPHDSC